MDQPWTSSPMIFRENILQKKHYFESLMISNRELNTPDSILNSIVKGSATFNPYKADILTFCLIYLIVPE